MYIKVPKLLKYKHLYMCLLQKINGLEHLQLRNVCQVVLSFLRSLFLYSK